MVATLPCELLHNLSSAALYAARMVEGRSHHVNSIHTRLSGCFWVQKLPIITPNGADFSFVFFSTHKTVIIAGTGSSSTAESPCDRLCQAGLAGCITGNTASQGHSDNRCKRLAQQNLLLVRRV